MSIVVAGILKASIGLLCDKLRDHAAKQLKDGEFTDEKCRQIIVRELDDINTQLKGLSRKDLLASISFFKEGVIRLYSSFNTYDASSGNEASTSKCDGGAAATKSQHDALERASELSKAIENLKITSQERYNSAKESFKESRKLATVAFNNEALSTEDRLLTTKLRIASRILECLDDPEAAVRDCLLYLEELQSLASMQDVFTLCSNAEKTVTDHLRALFNKKKRSAAIESIRMINTMLAELAECTNITMGIYDWPTIKIAKMIYHPLFDDREVLKKINPHIFYEIEGPWIWRFGRCIDRSREFGRYCALTSKGEILSRNTTRDALEIIRRRGECELFYTIPSENDGEMVSKILALDVDENDNIYIVKEITRCNKTVDNIQYKLLTLDANGDVKADKFLEIIDAPQKKMQLSVIQDGIVIIYSKGKNTVYICRSTNAEEDYKLTLPIPTKTSVSLSLTVSNKNEIIVVLGNDKRKAVMYIISLHDGTLKHEAEIPIRFQIGSHNVLDVVFNHVKERIVVNCWTVIFYFRASDDRFEPYKDLSEQELREMELASYIRVAQLYNFSETGELLHVFRLPVLQSQILSLLMWHPNGLTALVMENEAMMLQTDKTAKKFSQILQ